MSNGGFLGKGRLFWGAVIFLVGLCLAVLPYVSIPTNVVMHDTLDPANDHTSSKEIWLETGDYEIWMSENFWTNFNLDYPMVNINSSSGEPVHVYMHTDGSKRTIDDNRCRHFASFSIDEKGYYTVTVVAGLLSVGFPGSNELFLTEERPAIFGTLVWTGAIVMLVGFSVVTLELIWRVWKSKDKGLEESSDVPPPPAHPYPPPYFPPAPAPPPRLEEIPPPSHRQPGPPPPGGPPPQVQFQPGAPPRRPPPPY